MTTLALTLALLLYVAAAAAYVLAFARPRLAGAARAGLVLGGVAFVVQGIAIGLGCREHGGQELVTLRGGFGLAGWLAAGAHLLVQRLWRMPAAGAFALPLVVIAVLPGVFDPGSGGGPVPEVVRLPALQLHVTTALAGVALFALACGIALMYLLQERELKRKRFGALFSRLPSLSALDLLNARLVALGFAIFTVALVTGSLLAKREWCAFWEWDGQQVASVVVWALFGAMVSLRRAGAHGRRYATWTIVGFALVLGSIFGVRQVPGATKHRGDFEPSATTSAVACPDPAAANRSP